MKGTRNLVGVGAVTAALLALAACRGGEDTPDPAPSPSEGPRSIFADGAADGPQIPARSLPPLETTLSFADGTPELVEAVSAELATIVDSPQVKAGGPIILRGHSSSEGGDAENLASSRAQAEAVRDFLIENGIAEDRIRVIAFGEQNPTAPNALPDGSPNEEGRAQNRRVELTVVTAGSAERQETLVETISSPVADDRSEPGGNTASSLAQ